MWLGRAGLCAAFDCRSQQQTRGIDRRFRKVRVTFHLGLDVVDHRRERRVAEQLLAEFGEQDRFEKDPEGLFLPHRVIRRN